MTGLTVAIRVMQLGALITLLGAFAFLLLVAQPAFRNRGPELKAAFERLDRLILRLAAWSVLWLAGIALLGLWVQLALVTDRPLFEIALPNALGAFLLSTQYGWVWLVRLVLMGILGGLLIFQDREQDARDRWALRLAGAGLAGGLLMAQAWAGHAAAGEGSALILQITADTLHLLAVGVWVGGLPLLAVLLAWARRVDDPRADAIAAEATRRFSALGFASVLILVLTGLANAWTLVGSVPALVGTDYGRLLLLKVSLMFPLLAVAAVNLRREKPLLLDSVAERRHTNAREALGRLRRNALVEAALGVCILLLVGGLGVLPPARHLPPTWPFSFRLSWEATKNLPGVWSSVLLGSLIALLGLLALGYAAAGRRYRLPAAGVGLAGVVCGVWLAGRAIAIDAYPTTYLRPGVPYQAISIANGLRLYGEHCAFCHGVSGYGDGPAAAILRPRPADLTAKHTADHTAGDMFWWLSHGIKGSAMPGFQDRLSEEERWDMINFVRTLSAAEQARSMGPWIEPLPWLVAPDFSHTTSLGEGQMLRDYRGQQMVLLIFFSLPASAERLAQLQELYPRLREPRVAMLGVPLQPDRDVHRELSGLPVSFPLVVEGAAEVAATYSLFRKSVHAVGGQPSSTIPSHLEFLIDRQGYIRARWMPTDSHGLGDMEELLITIAQLHRERPRAPAPDEHVH